MKLLGIIFAVLLGNFAQAEELPYIMCKNLKIVRTIRIEPLPESKGCQTMYNKAGVDRVVGTAQVSQSCVSFLNNVRSNLEKAHWKCRDVSANMIQEDGE